MLISFLFEPNSNNFMSLIYNYLKMKKLLPAIFFSLSGALSFAQTEVLLDNSIEAASTWTSTSTNFGSVLCTNATCGNCGGPCGPHTGTQYAWFGGAGGAAETGTLSQNFSVTTAGTGVLSFYFRTPMVPGVLGDTFTAVVDGNTVFTATPADSNQYQDAYTQVVIPLGNLTAGSHDIVFTGTESSVGTFNQLLDDISILVGSVNVEELFLDEYVTMSQNMMNNEVVVSTNFPTEIDMRVIIYDQTGKQVYVQMMNNAKNSTLTISTADLAAGTYVIDFIKNDSNPFSRNFTVVK
jgi:hypothetical protein